MTIQVQSPFTSVAIESENSILADLAARGHGLRTEVDQSAIFAAYEQLVAYAASNLRVVTSEDILQLAD